MEFTLAISLIFMALLVGLYWGVHVGRAQANRDAYVRPQPEPPLTGDSVGVLLQNAIDRANARANANKP